MRLEAQKYLFDIQRAAALLTEFTAPGRRSPTTRRIPCCAAVEREFEVIGEALARLAKLDKDLAAQISEHERIIAFRNILIHGYATVDDRIVWGVIENYLAALKRGVDQLLAGP